MTKKILISVIAVVLVAAVIGSCFALYKLSADDVVVNIDATTDTCELTINTSASLDFADISPDNATKSVNITLSTTDNELVDGVSGNFKIAITGGLANAFNCTVVAYDSTFTTPGAELPAALGNDGATIALSAVPKYYKLTLTLKDIYDEEGFAAIAEATGTITISWTIVEGSVFVYDSHAYYAIGKINGVSSWDPNVARYELTTEGVSGNNVAQALNVYFKDGDEFKVVWNFYEEGQAAMWYGGDYGNVTITQGDGYYNIYLYDDGGYKVSISKVE